MSRMESNSYTTLIYEGANKIVDEKITVTPDLGTLIHLFPFQLSDDRFFS